MSLHALLASQGLADLTSSLHARKDLLPCHLLTSCHIKSSFSPRGNLSSSSSTGTFMPFISTSCLVNASTLRICQRAESSLVSSAWVLWWEAYPGQPRADVPTVQGCDDGRQTSYPTAGSVLGLASSREPLNNHFLPPPPPMAAPHPAPRIVIPFFMVAFLSLLKVSPSSLTGIRGVGLSLWGTFHLLM